MTVAPKKALGQHFLVDENILGVIERLSDLHSTDVYTLRRIVPADRGLPWG